MFVRLIFLLVICATLCSAYAETIYQAPLYVGISKVDRPYSLLNSKREASGLLVHFVDSICVHLQRRCDYTTKKYINLIKDLKNQQIDALLISDQVVLEQIDQVSISPPICRIKPVFVQKSASDHRLNQMTDLAQKKIGVRAGSALHFYLIENHSAHAYIKPYHMTESAIFDLFFERLDAVFVDEAFYQERVLQTPLGRAEPKMRLMMTKIDGISLPYKSMSIAVSRKNSALYGDIVDYMSKHNLVNCTDLPTKNS